jgi:hypothetical protein
MSDTHGPDGEIGDGQVPDAGRVADTMAIQGLAIAYAHAVDDTDWDRWEALFTPDAHIDYASSGGIVGNPAAMAAWLPDAMAIFTWTMHSIYSHEIRFTADDRATGRVHLFNRNGVEWKGESEIFDVGGFYDDDYVRVDGSWRFARRVERTVYLDGGAFAEMLREMIASKGE